MGSKGRTVERQGVKTFDSNEVQRGNDKGKMDKYPSVWRINLIIDRAEFGPTGTEVSVSEKSSESVRGHEFGCDTRCMKV